MAPVKFFLYVFITFGATTAENIVSCRPVGGRIRVVKYLDSNRAGSLEIAIHFKRALEARADFGAESFFSS